MNEKKVIKEIEEAIEKLKKTFDVKCGLRNYAYYSEMISDLYRQLQAYKDREDKVKNYCEDELFRPNCDGETHGKHLFATDVLQILNEGDEINEFCNK